MNMQKFPSLNYYFGLSTVVVWENAKGEIETSERERYYLGEQSELMFNEKPEDNSIQQIMFSVFKNYKDTLNDFLKCILQKAREKSPHKCGEIVEIVEPYQRMTKMKIEQVAGVLAYGKTSCAYIGRMIRKNGDLTGHQVICLASDIKEE